MQAEHLAIVGDEMVRTFYDSTSGWQTSRVDIVGSNELLASNWTAGIGVLTVGDKYSKPTALIPYGTGELVMKPEGDSGGKRTSINVFNIGASLEKMPPALQARIRDDAQDAMDSVLKSLGVGTVVDAQPVAR